MLDLAIQRSLAVMLGQGRLSVTKSVSGNLSRLRAYPIIARAVEDKLPFWYSSTGAETVLSRLRAATRISGLSHTYGRADMQKDWAVIRDNVGIKGLLEDKPGDYVPQAFEFGIGAPWQKRNYLEMAHARFYNPKTRLYVDLEEPYLTDHYMTADMVRSDVGDWNSWWGLTDEWELVGFHIGEAYRKAGVIEE